MRLSAFIVLILLMGELYAQENRTSEEQYYPFDRKEEIIHRNKRYRIHNNYLTLGFGYGNSSLRNRSQKIAAADFQFHIRKHHFQTGVMMSGNEFLSNNHIQLHAAYGLRREGKTRNLAAFLGPAYFTGVTGDANGNPELYQGVGGYVCVQAVVKLAYDIGIGIELFDEFSARQNIYGFKIIAFFSGAYRGVKRNYNPNVRSERGG